MRSTLSKAEIERAGVLWHEAIRRLDAHYERQRIYNINGPHGEAIRRWAHDRWMQLWREYKTAVGIND